MSVLSMLNPNEVLFKLLPMDFIQSGRHISFDAYKIQIFNGSVSE